jgi:hypothetical protein
MPDATAAKNAQLSFRLGVYFHSRYIETMKCAGLFILAITLLLAATARAQQAEGASDAGTVALDKPYAGIVARNMFGLVPIPPADPNANQPPADPPPKITPNGIMTIFGKLQALFKVSAKPGQPPKETSYVLTEGERQDEIEVVKINQPDGIITFNNHGIIQELPLANVDNAASSGPSAAPSALPGGIPMPGSGFNPGMSGGLSPQERNAIRRRSLGGLPNNGGNPGGAPAFGGGNNNQPANANIEDQVMSSAKQMAQIELNRIATQDAVDKGLMPPLPPTLLTPPDATGPGGAPLIIPPSGAQQPQ